MPNKIYIRSAATVTALGLTLDETWMNLQSGETASRDIDRFSTAAIDHKKAALVRENWFSGTRDLQEELLETVLSQLPSLSTPPFIIWTGVKSNTPFIESEGGYPLKDGAGFRENAAEYLKIPNRGIELNAACASSAAGLALGAMMIKSGKADSVLICSADKVSRFIHFGFSSLKALSSYPARPFDLDRDGLNLGDGASAVLLCGEKVLNGDAPLAELAGWGIANDANHITGPARDGRGLVLAVKQALNTASAGSADVAAFCAHGTGTRYNDSMEVEALKQIFGETPPPVFSLKGAVGHTLGAAGGIETAVCVKALKEKTVPPTAGIENPEPYLANRISSKPQAIGKGCLLTTNSGFGGVNAALLIKDLS